MLLISFCPVPPSCAIGIKCSDETVSHFLGSCPRFQQERDGYKQRMDKCIQDCPEAAEIKEVLQANDELKVTKLLLGQKMVDKLPSNVAKAVESIGLNYIKLIWAKREKDWLCICEKDAETGKISMWKPFIA